MPTSDATTIQNSVFDIEEDYNFKAEPVKLAEDVAQKSPSAFLNGLDAGTNNAPAKPTLPEQVPVSNNPQAFASQPFAPVNAASTFSMNSLPSNSLMAQSVVNQLKERMNNIKPWKDFFSLDQFRMPQSTTAAQSRVSHNVNFFQNNYLMFVALLSVFSL